MNSKTIIRAPRSAEKPYFVTSRAAAQDASLSLQARGMLWYLLSKPDDWEIRISDLMRAGACGRSRVYAILKELREHGYLVGRSKQRKSDGTFEWTEYQVIEEPNSDPAEPTGSEPCVENPDTENHHIIQNREYTKYNTPNGVGATGVSSAETPGGVESVPHDTEETNSGAGAMDGTSGGGRAGSGRHGANPPPTGSNGSRNDPRREKAGRSDTERAMAKYVIEHGWTNDSARSWRVVDAFRAAIPDADAGSLEAFEKWYRGRNQNAAMPLAAEKVRDWATRWYKERTERELYDRLRLEEERERSRQFELYAKMFGI